MPQLSALSLRCYSNTEVSYQIKFIRTVPVKGMNGMPFEKSSRTRRIIGLYTVAMKNPKSFLRADLESAKQAVYEYLRSFHLNVTIYKF